MPRKKEAYSLDSGLSKIPELVILSNRSPNGKDLSYAIGQFWIVKNTGDVFALVKISTGRAIWQILGGPQEEGDVKTLTGDSGLPATPDLAKNINIVGTNGIETTTEGNTVSINNVSIPMDPISTIATNSGGAVSPDENGSISILGANNIQTSGSGNTVMISDNGNPIESLSVDGGTTVSPDNDGDLSIVGSGGVAVTGDTQNNTITIAATSSKPPITNFVVGPNTEYTTIQSAINAASTTGPNIIWIQPGEYTENLSLAGNLTLISVSGNVKIIGTEALSQNVRVNYHGLILQNTNRIINLGGTQTADLRFFDCEFIVTQTSNNLFSLLNNGPGIEFHRCSGVCTLNYSGSGPLTIENCSFLGPTTTSLLFNGTGPLKIRNSIFHEIYLLANASGAMEIYNCDLYKRLNFRAIGSLDVINSILRPIDNASALIYYGTGAITISSSTIDTSGTSIIGYSAAPLKLLHVNFTNNNSISIPSSSNLQNPGNSHVGKLNIKGGAVTDSVGRGTLVNGTLQVLNTTVNDTDRIFVTRSNSNSSTAVGTFRVTIINNTSFTIQSLKANASIETGDLSTINYLIVRQT